ncbi:cache domain-containing protein [Methanoplanus endosymbiosus]|uniref:Cache domain-containing protein n=1 Tax=Methanoplanus endosymbiosus TaxID=33865 RepID=A0A9E7TM86_9EURY|nr:cache domain-containing protein [Methanoplanus endosymbiosus]UUX93061.1 cache domain-containing protein [Methanoplanus endosymbiosus]
MNKVLGLFISGIFLILLLSAGCTGTGSGDESTGADPQTEIPAEIPIPDEMPDQYGPMKENFSEIISGVNSGLEAVKSDLKSGADAVAAFGPSSPETGKVISDYLVKHPYSISSLVFDENGIVVNAYPDNYRNLVGMDLGRKGIVAQAPDDRKPYLSSFFRMEEGFNALSQGYPVYDKDGSYPGSVDMTYKSQDFLGRYIKPVTDSTDFDVWVVQTDGTEIYDTTPEEVGRNLLTDESYQSDDIQAFVRGVIDNRNGTGKYSFWDKEWANPVEKYALWDTAGIDGTEWRIVITWSKDGGKSVISDDVTSLPAGVSAEYEVLREYVHSAAEFARNSGKVEALAEFNDINGSFTDGDKYIFAYEMDGTVIALPFQKALLGSDRSESVDPNGADFINGMIDLAEDGGGYIYYVYTNPSHDYRKELKLSYAEPVDENWFVGSGIYVPDIPVNFSADDIEKLVLRVKSARQYAQDNDKETVISEYNNISGKFAEGGSYIFAYETDGTTLALPYQPELIGTNRLNFTDIYGVPVLKLEITEAENGGGFVYVQYPDPDYNESRFKLCYVLPVDENWFVGSGTYTESI